MKKNFSRILKVIIRKDPRYKEDAYLFVMEALWFTQRSLKREGHVTGGELLEGIKDLLKEQYGPMAKVVLEHWGVNKTEDFGEIVFNMVENGLMGRTAEDSRADFKDVYDFDAAFDIVQFT